MDWLDDAADTGEDEVMGNLSFVHPWIALSGLALAAVPILIHILNRRRFRRVVWAAMRFLEAAYRRNTRRIRIEQMVLLATRVLIMVLMALAVARPLAGPGVSGTIGRLTHHRVLVLDDSYSMGMLAADGTRTFDTAGSAARRLLDGFDRDDAVTLITSSKPARRLTNRPSYDRTEVLRLLQGSGLSDATTDMAGALALAAETLAKSPFPSSNRIVYVLTDGTAVAWSGGHPERVQAVREASQRVGALGRLVLIDLGPDDRDNVAVTSVRLAVPALSADWPATIDADVTNYGRSEAARLHLQVVLNGDPVRTEPVETVPPFTTKTTRFRVQLPGPGSHQLAVGWVGEPADVLPLDNVRRLCLDCRKEIPVLIVDGRPGLDRFSGQAGYLAAALAPGTGPADRSPIKPRVVTLPELPDEPLADYAAVVLCNVRQLPEQTWSRIDRFVRQGGGLMVFMGDLVNQEEYNRFAFAEGRGILPARLSGLVGSPDDRAKFVQIRSDDLSHPAVADFVGQSRSGLFLARFFRHTRLVVPAEMVGASVALRYDNGDPALVVRNVDRGRVVLAGFTANMDWTNLPAKGDYVSLVMGLMAWMVGDPAANRNLTVDESLVEVLGARAASLPVEVLCPDGRRVVPVLGSQPTSDGVQVRFDRTDRVGGYRLMVGSQSIDFVVNPDPTEGDLRRISAQELREALGTAFEYERDVASLVAEVSSGAKREIAQVLFWIVLGLVVLETALAMWFGHHRR